MLPTLIGLFSLGIIVLVHEFGHYITARYNGIVVEEFAVGIGPKLISFNKKNTIWSIRLLPLGGFCRMRSPDIAAETDKNKPFPDMEGSFNNASYRAKAIVLLGGPVANIILFVLLSLALYTVGGGKEYSLSSYIDPIGEPANSSELRTGDKITAINDIEISSYSQLAETATALRGTSVTIKYLRTNDHTTNTNNIAVPRSTTVLLNDQTPALGILPYISPVITYIEPNSIVDTLGLQVGDRYVEINGTQVQNAIHIPSLLSPEPDYKYPVPFYIERSKPIDNAISNNNSNTQTDNKISDEANTSSEIRIENIETTDQNTATSERIKFEILPLNTDINLRALGIKEEVVMYEKWNSFSNFVRARTKEATSIMSSTFSFFGDLLQLKTKKIASNTAGPIRLISIVGNSTISNAKEFGLFTAIVQLFNITALLSIAIASLNLLPLPVLDGGQLLFYSFFRIRKKQPTIKTHTQYNGVGSIILLLLFGFIIFMDIFSFF